MILLQNILKIAILLRWKTNLWLPGFREDIAVHASIKSSIRSVHGDMILLLYCGGYKILHITEFHRTVQT
jgi:hypothetical protein